MINIQAFTNEQDWSDVAAHIERAQPGDCLRFAAGRYRCTRTVSVPAGVQITGDKGTEIVTDVATSVFDISADKIEITGITLSALCGNNGLVRIRGSNQVLIADCQLAGGGQASCAILAEQTIGLNIKRCDISGFAVANLQTVKKDSAALCFIGCQGEVIDCEIHHNSCASSVVWRDLSQPNRISNMDFYSNRCHDNKAGIIYSGSKGEARDNEFWNSAYSIWIRPYEGQASEVVLISNRCHDNENGISYSGSKGEARDNECWGNKGFGIGIQLYEDLVSEVVLINNRCHDNGPHGIMYIGSKGEARDNECWDNKGDGIFIQACGNLVSEVVLINNRCHDNEQGGIAYEASKGEARDNECWGSKSGNGITIQSWGGQVSEVVLINNRCHDNRVGILYFGSKGEARHNECWDNNNVGINIESRGEQVSEVVLINNRCHDNGVAILYQDSKGEARDNECRGGKNGIFIRSDGGQASEVALINNRCHNNKESGIVYLASKGEARNNECWGSQLGYGFNISPHKGQASEVVLINNRCHDNELDGIVYFGSKGEARDNECWGNKAGGIRISSSNENQAQASEVVLINNRCHDNEQVGIKYLASKGEARDNECWDNRAGDDIALQSADVTCTGHRTIASLEDAPAFAGTPLGDWLKDDLENWKQRLRAAKLVMAGPCWDCFQRFGNAGAPVPMVEGNAAEVSGTLGSTNLSNPQFTPAPSIYHLKQDSAGLHFEKNMPVHALSTGKDALSWLLEQFKDRMDSLQARDTPCWSVAMASANENEVDACLKQEWPSHCVSIGFAGEENKEEQEQEQEARKFIEKNFMPDVKNEWQRWALRLRVLADLPIGLALEFCLSFLPVCIGFAILIFSLDTLSWPEDMSNLSELLKSLASMSAPLVLATILFMQLGLNRNLPSMLGVSVDWLEFVANNVSGLSFVKRMFSPLSPRESAWRHWLCGQIYGKHSFRWRQRKPVLVMIKNLDVVNAHQQKLLRLIMSLRPPRQSVLFLTSIPGTSMLVSAYLDIWYPKNTTSSEALRFEGYLVHDPASARIEKAIKNIHESSIAIPSDQQEKSQEPNEELKQILGWEGDSDIQGNINSLKDPAWSSLDVMPMLILGSTPILHMAFYRKRVALEQDHQYLEDLQKWLSTCYEIFRSSHPEKNTAPIQNILTGEKWSDHEKHAKKASGVIVYQMGKESIGYAGRVGYRVRLADAIKMNIADNHYLGLQIACGEVFHLQEAIKLLEMPSPDFIRAALHAESALFLMHERTQLLSEDDSAHECPNKCWRTFGEALNMAQCPADNKLAVSVRLCMPWVAAAEILWNNGDWFSDWKNLVDKAILSVAASAESANNPWAGFIAELASTITKLAGLPEASRELLLDTKFRQDWYSMPESCRAVVHASVQRFLPNWRLALAKLGSSQAMLKHLMQLRQQPALVLFSLIEVASPLLRVGYAKRKNATEASLTCQQLQQSAKALLDLHQAAGGQTVTWQIKKFESLRSEDVCEEASRAAVSLLTDVSCVETLAIAFRKGVDERKNMEGMIKTMGIDGIALGVHGKLYGILEQVSEITLGDSK